MVISVERAGAFRIGFLLIDGFALMSYASAVEPLRAANLLADRTVYDIRHLAAGDRRGVSSSGSIVEASAHLGRDVDFDLVLVVAGGDPGSFADDRVFNWLRQLARRGVRLGGVSGGPVLLALAGLMEGRRMTVHWEHAPTLAEISSTLIVERTLYVMDRDRITCAGGTAPLDMMHALINEHHGPAFARQISDWFMHTEIRPSGGPQRAGLVERYGINDPALIQAIEMMENHVADPLDLAQVAQLSGVGPRQLNRLFRQRLGRSTMAFYRELRLEKASNLLTQSTLSLTEIALATGFASSAHFSKAFRDVFGRAPSSFRARPHQDDTGLAKSQPG
ncbi:GlxA family transcriptional regulator [Aurantimonas marina]|uniref:GlxA family transcriptional regulator n=1 Tax=Aurantimonas marina TaxID=2780508 RepID=UPI0019D022CA|nr:GlxA family transcriptional regulator [Aurantimonas marina]